MPPTKNTDGCYAKPTAVATPLLTPEGPETWTTGLCCCSSDASSCCLTWCCPCITFGRNAEIIDQGNPSCFRSGATYAVLMQLGWAWMYSFFHRTKLRRQFSLPGDQCGDCCIHFWCHPCALCQESRELKNRGFDPSIGWVANQNKTGTAKAPAVQMWMTRE